MRNRSGGVISAHISWSISMNSIEALAMIMCHQGAESKREFLGRISTPLIKLWLPTCTDNVIDYVKACIDKMYYKEKLL